MPANGLLEALDGDDLHDGPGHVEADGIAPLFRDEVDAKAFLPEPCRQPIEGVVSDVVVAADCPEAALERKEANRACDTHVIRLARRGSHDARIASTRQQYSAEASCAENCA
jgi:hypothetical protein